VAPIEVHRALWPATPWYVPGRPAPHVTGQGAGQAAEQLRLSRPAPFRTGEQVGAGSPDVDTENQDQENSGDDRGGDLPGEGVGVAPS